MQTICNLNTYFKRRRIIALACLTAVVMLAGCKNNPSSTPVAERVARPDANTASKRISDSSRILMDAMKDPKAPFHYSYKGQENINTKYPMDKTAKPEVGAVTLEADLTPDELNIASSRGTKKEETKGKKSDQLAWSMGQLTLLGGLTNATFSIAVGTTIATVVGSDMVGGVAADKYTYDTSLATGSQKTGIDIAKSMLTNIHESKGTVCVAKDSGELVKFNIDSSYADKNGNAWQEHYEGEVTPK